MCVCVNTTYIPLARTGAQTDPMRKVAIKTNVDVFYLSAAWRSASHVTSRSRPLSRVDIPGPSNNPKQRVLLNDYGVVLKHSGYLEKGRVDLHLLSVSTHTLQYETWLCPGIKFGKCHKPKERNTSPTTTPQVGRSFPAVCVFEVASSLWC